MVEYIVAIDVTRVRFPADATGRLRWLESVMFDLDSSWCVCCGKLTEQLKFVTTPSKFRVTIGGRGSKESRPLRGAFPPLWDRVSLPPLSRR